MQLGVAAALVDGELVQGDVSVDDGRVTAVGIEPAAAAGLAVPGFVDAHVNGFAGVDFMGTDPEGYRTAAAALASTGVVAFQPTFVSAPVADTIAALETAAATTSEPGLPLLTGVHLEGPFLSPLWPGAHDPAALRAPDPRLAVRLCEHGPVRTVTLAPELAGGMELVELLVARGVVVSCGHSDADAETARAAFDHGARAITHIYNAHRRWEPRDPGLGGVALVHPGVTVQAIVDGIHLAPESAYAAFLAAGERFCLVTDAIEAATLTPGDYRLGQRAVHVDDGAVRLDDGTLAGSVLTLDQALRNLVACGAPLAAAAHAAAGASAALLGRPDLGVLRPGRPAHVTVLDDDLQVTRTLVGGAEAFAS
ncbi:MAG TPA: N-acetylglucosamine-6-phosphate deacetylase [Thermoleophilaceae bacterium]